MPKQSDPTLGVKTRYELFITHQTNKAWQVVLDKRKREQDVAFWLPKSQVDFTDGGNGWGVFAVPLWLAHEKGLDPSLHGFDATDLDDGGISG